METTLAPYLILTGEWELFVPFLAAIRQPNGRKSNNHRLVLDGVFWIARTGALWRDLPEEFGKWSNAYRQFRRWTLAGLWELILDALTESRTVPDVLLMADSMEIFKNDDEGKPTWAPVITMPDERTCMAMVGTTLEFSDDALPIEDDFA